MKKFFLIACAMVMTLAASAQIVTSRSSSVKTTVKESDNYSRIYAGYSNLSFGGDGMNGLTLGYLKGINVANIPLYVEAGGEVSWNTAEWDDLVSISIPVSLSYKFDLENNISIMPFTGPNFRFNVYDDVVDTDFYNVFQAGWNVGVGFSFSKFYVGYRFTAGFNDYYKHSDEGGKVNTVTVGYQF